MVNDPRFPWNRPEQPDYAARNGPISLIEGHKDEVALFHFTPTGKGKSAGIYIAHVYHAELLHRGEPVDFVYATISMEPNREEPNGKRWETTNECPIRLNNRVILLENILAEIARVMARGIDKAITSFKPAPPLSMRAVTEHTPPPTAPVEKTGIAGVAEDNTPDGAE